MLDFIYAEEKLTINKLYEFPPFDQTPFIRTPSNVIQWVLAELVKMDASLQAAPDYKQTLFIKIITLIQKETVSSFSAYTSAYVLDYLTRMLTSDLDHLNVPFAQIEFLFEKIYEQKNQIDTRSLSLAFLSISILVSLKKLTDINLLHVMELGHVLKGRPDSMFKEYGVWSFDHLCTPEQRDSTVNLVQPKVAEIKESAARMLQLSKSIKSDIFKIDVSQEDKNKLLEAVLYSNRMEFLKIYQLTPFNIDIKYQNIETVIQYYLTNIIKTAADTIKQTMLNTICDAIEENFQADSKDNNTEKNVNILWSFAKLSEYSFIMFKEKLIHKIIDQMQFAIPKMGSHDLVKSIWAIAKLVSLKKLASVNVSQVTAFLDQLYSQSGSVMVFGNISNTLWSMAKLREAISGFPIKTGQIGIWMIQLYKLQEKCRKPYEISNTFWALAKLINLGELKSLKLDYRSINNLLDCFVKLNFIKPPDIANLMWAIPILIENGNLDFIESDQLRILFERLCCQKVINSECIIKYLWSTAKFLAAKKIEINDINILHLEDMCSRLYLLIDVSQLNSSQFIATSFLVDTLWSLATLLELGLPITIDSQKIEMLLNLINYKYNATLEQIEITQQVIAIFVEKGKLSQNSLIVQEFFQNYSAEEKKDAIEPKIKPHSIKLPRENLAPVVFETSDLIHELTGKEVFLGGSGGPNAALKIHHKSDYDLRVFDLSDADKDKLYEHFQKIAIPGTCIRNDSGDHPKIQFELFRNGKRHLFQIATSWRKLTGEADDAAMFRMVDNGGINLESLYVPLTNKSPQLELKGSEFDISTFRQKRISLRNPGYFEEDPLRVLRFIKKVMDYQKYGFKPDENIMTILRDKNLKRIIYGYLKSNENNKTNVGRFTTGLQSLVTHHSLSDVIAKMHNMGVLNAIINLRNFTFSDLKSTLICLTYYDSFPPEIKRSSLGYFLLAHFCAKHSHLPLERKKALLNHWQLKDVIWNTINPFYQDFTVRELLDRRMPLDSKLTVTEPHFLTMLKRIRTCHRSARYNMQRNACYANNENPVFAGREASHPAQISHNTHQVRSRPRSG